MTKENLGCAISGHSYGWEQADKDGANKILMREIIFLGPCCKCSVQGCIKGNHEIAVHARKDCSELFG